MNACRFEKTGRSQEVSTREGILGALTSVVASSKPAADDEFNRVGAGVHIARGSVGSSPP